MTETLTDRPAAPGIRWDDREIYPNFLIAGAAKAGTTSLFEYIRQHPDVFMPTDLKRKEPHFFVHNKLAAFRELPDYLELFREGRGKKAIGEASTGYLYSPESASWIRAVLGQIKIIILLRNPAKRAFSFWANMARDGFEDAPTFERALELEPIRRSRIEFEEQCLQTTGVYSYFATGLYFEQVQRYFACFGRENVAVYLFEEFVKDPLGHCRQVFEFLGVDPEFVPRIDVHNQGGSIPRFVSLQRDMQAIALGRKSSLPFYLVPRRWRTHVIETIKDWNLRLGPKTSLAKPLYKKLMEDYWDDIKRLEELLGRDLSIWYGDPAKSARQGRG